MDSFNGFRLIYREINGCIQWALNGSIKLVIADSQALKEVLFSEVVVVRT